MRKFISPFHEVSIKFLLLLPLILFCCRFTNAQSANLVLRNAKVYTVDKNNPNAEAIAIKDDKILFVGSEKDVN